MRFVENQGLELKAILITHHHGDHVGGLRILREKFSVPVYAPAREKIDGVDHWVEEGASIAVPGLTSEGFAVLDVPGHTAGHVAYYGENALFCGDTLFSAGCGRIFEGTAMQMFQSLAKLAALPGHTQVYCAHEYTLSNLHFSRLVDANNIDRDHYAAHCEALCAMGQPTLPSSIALERDINPFLRCDEVGVIAAVAKHFESIPEDAADCFAMLREWKNQV